MASKAWAVRLKFFASASLTDRSISAAHVIDQTADKIGVEVDALQELRFAAKASGMEQQQLDMALLRFTRRAAEAALADHWLPGWNDRSWHFLRTRQASFCSRFWIA